MRQTFSKFHKLIFFALAIYLIPPAFAHANTPRKTLKPSYIASMIISPVHHKNDPGYAIIKNYLRDCSRPVSIQTGSPKIKISTVFVYPVKKRPSTCRDYLRTRKVSGYKGTILLFPGYGLGKSTLVGYANFFSDMGFVSVLVDLPGQGKSGGHLIGYGPYESSYIKSLINELQKKKMLTKKLLVFGISYGATVAVDTAAKSKKISGVIAIAPFVNVVPTIFRYITEYDANKKKSVTKTALTKALGIDKIKLGYSLYSAGPLNFASRIKFPVLYIAAANDKLVPLSKIKKLADQTPDASLEIIKKTGHVGIVINSKPIIARIRPWLIEKGY